MHTFFINTSHKNLGYYEELFDIYVENMVLVPLECPMSKWYHPEQGYAGCVNKMSALIDGFVEIDDAFNLILYVDLSEQDMYASLPRDPLSDIKRNACLSAMRTLLTHVVNDTIVRVLKDIGRQPRDILVMFGEDKRFANRNAGPANDNAERNAPTLRAVDENIHRLLGIPAEETIIRVAKAVLEGKDPDHVEAFGREIAKVWGPTIFDGIRDSYTEDLALWYDAVICEQNIPHANEELIDRVKKRERSHLENEGTRMLSCPYDFYASTANKKVQAISCMNIALHLLKCVRANTIYTEQSADQRQKELIPFREYKVEEIAPRLLRKQYHYAEMARRTAKMDKLYSDLGMAPRLPVFNHGKFGLDEFGKKAISLVVTDAEEKAASADPEKHAEEVIKVEGNGKQVEVVVKTGGSLFSKTQYQPFDYTGTYMQDEMLQKGKKPEEYVKKALELREHHLLYLQKLQSHVTLVLTNYAGKSKNNKAALLTVGGTEYALTGEGNEFSNDLRDPELVEPVAQMAYTTMLDQYMHFCAGRSVAITDIEEQCNWYVSRINQISESIHKMQWIGMGAFGALLALYIPFVAIQFEAITRNMFTLCAALGSIGVPMLLLGGGLAALSVLQRKKYVAAGKELIQRSNQIIAENETAARKFDQLLSAAIPALRWVYEYKLDAEYCAECCDVADAKVEHHRKKMMSRAAAIENIISDLDYRDTEYDEAAFEQEKLPENVDYNRPYCVGNENITFYTIADHTLLGEEGRDA